MNLSNLIRPKGSRKRNWIVGRGDGSGSGKCCGYGHKGAKSHEGRGKGYGSGYEGGQTRSYLRIPKIRGWRNQIVRPIKIAHINLDQLDKISEGTEVTLEVLRTFKLAQKTDKAYKILGRGKIAHAINFKHARATKSAINIIQKAGGTIELVGVGTEKESDEQSEPIPPRQAKEKPAVDTRKSEDTEEETKERGD